MDPHCPPQKLILYTMFCEINGATGGRVGVGQGRWKGPASVHPLMQRT